MELLTPPGLQCFIPIAIGIMQMHAAERGSVVRLDALCLATAAVRWHAQTNGMGVAEAG